MIIGNGMIAKEFSNYKNDNQVVIFASGVSNSNEKNENEFKREEDLLVETIEKLQSRKIIYFSTCSMYDNYFKNNAYTNHKLKMESIIKKLSQNFLIIRLPQVIGKNNKYQLMGFFYNKILNNNFFELYDIERNIINIIDIKKIINYIIKENLFKNEIVNIANQENIKVIDLVKSIENILNQKALYTLVELKGNFVIDISKISSIIKKLQLFDDNYVENIIRSYYE